MHLHSQGFLDHTPDLHAFPRELLQASLEEVPDRGLWRVEILHELRYESEWNDSLEGLEGIVVAASREGRQEKKVVRPFYELVVLHRGSISMLRAQVTDTH
jgi:hypothetical protein